MSQHLRNVYASYRKRKRGEGQLPDGPTVLPADAAECVEREGEPGREVRDEPGPSVSDRGERGRAEVMEEDFPDGSTAPRSKAAERMRRYRKRKKSGGVVESVDGTSVVPATEDAAKSSRRRTGDRGGGTGSGVNWALESRVQGKCSGYYVALESECHYLSQHISCAPDFGGKFGLSGLIGLLFSFSLRFKQRSVQIN